MSDHLEIGGDNLLPPELATRPAIVELESPLVIKIDPDLFYVHGDKPEVHSEEELDCVGGLYYRHRGEWYPLLTPEFEPLLDILSYITHGVLALLDEFEGFTLVREKP